MWLRWCGRCETARDVTHSPLTISAAAVLLLLIYSASGDGRKARKLVFSFSRVLRTTLQYALHSV